MNIRARGVVAITILVLCGVIGQNIYRRILYQQLTKAVFEGDLTATKRLLQKGASPRPTKGLLGFSILNHRTEIAKVLIEAGAEPTGRALALAVKENDTEIALLLLEKGADVTIGTRYFTISEPLLYSAADNENVQIVTALLQHHAPLDKPYDSTGVTPLHQSVIKNSISVAELLLTAGASPNIPDIFLNTPLTSAVKNENLEMVRLLVHSHADIDQKGIKNYTPLLTACAQGNEEIVAYLLEQKANTRATTLDGFTSLRLARAFPKIVEMLLKARAEE